MILPNLGIPDIQTIEDNIIFKQQITNYFRNQDSNIKD